MRADIYLSTHDGVRSRTHAKELIASGFARIDGTVIRRPSEDIDEHLPHTVEITGAPHPFVGRGGVKLEGALTYFDVSVTGVRAVDIGASTGGFTDCLLRRGASLVYAVDSGSGQLAESLREDERVINLEQCNARTLSPEHIGGPCDIAVADVSFISQTYILPPAAALLREGGLYIGLIKPQFEVGRAHIGKHGIVRDADARVLAIRTVTACAAQCGLVCCGLMVSPIRGGDGNTEYLMLCRRETGERAASLTDEVMERTVKCETNWCVYRRG